MKLLDWWHRHFTRLGRDLAWRERYARRRGHAYPGHVPPRPMPAPASAEPGRVPRPSEWPDPPPMPSLARPTSPIWPPAPPRPRHHGMAIVAVETIPAGQMITLNACADGAYEARARRLGHE